MSRSTKWREGNRLVIEELSRNIYVSDQGRTSSVGNETGDQLSDENTNCFNLELDDSFNGNSFLDVPLNDRSCSSSDFESDDSMISHDPRPIAESSNLASNLREWSNKFSCSQASVTALLKVLRENGISNLPMDARTLLKTPRNLEMKSLFGGSYFYLGLESSIRVALESIQNVELPTEIELTVNVDGLPIFKSSDAQIWPILCSFSCVRPFAVAIFYGNHKPQGANEFLQEFLDEFSHLKDSGLMFGNQKYNVKIKYFCCDAPARAYLKYVKTHSGYDSCERCQVHGSYHGRVVFHEIDCDSRSGIGFSNKIYKDHQIGESILPLYGIDCVSMFVLDPMHLVYLGVVRRLIFFWIEGPLHCRISQRHINTISQLLQSIQKETPSEFNRRPRSLNLVKRWKATELRQFLLYTGPVVLKGILEENMYNHFLTLFVSMSILTEKNLSEEALNYAQELLRWFVVKSENIYGPTFQTYNVHSLVHLPDDMRNFQKNADEISAFKFENYLKDIKSMVRNCKNPTVQVVNRIRERDQFQNQSLVTNYPMKISSKSRDRWFLLDDKVSVVQIKNSCSNYPNHYECNVYAKDSVHDFFNIPCKSSMVGVLFLQDASTHNVKIIHKSRLLSKFYGICRRNGIVLMKMKDFS